MGGYEAELRAVKALPPENNRGLEVGVGTGRFAEMLGIRTGLEPSVQMREIARNRGIKILAGVAEDLPFGDDKFYLVLMIKTVCFLDDIHKAFREALRVLANGGVLLAGIVDRNSLRGNTGQKRANLKKMYYGAADACIALAEAELEDIVQRCSKSSNSIEIIP